MSRRWSACAISPSRSCMAAISRASAQRATASSSTNISRGNADRAAISEARKLLHSPDMDSDQSPMLESRCMMARTLTSTMTTRVSSSWHRLGHGRGLSGGNLPQSCPSHSELKAASVRLAFNSSAALKPPSKCQHTGSSPSSVAQPARSTTEGLCGAEFRQAWQLTYLKGPRFRFERGNLSAPCAVQLTCWRAILPRRKEL